MEETVLFSHSLMMMPKFQLNSARKMLISRTHTSPPRASTTCMTKQAVFPTFYPGQKKFSWWYKAHVVSDSKAPTTFTVDSAGQGVDIHPDSGGSDDNFGGPGGHGDGGNNNGDGGNNDGEGGSDKGEEPSGKGKSGMSMSQKLTLGFAAIVGVGGTMGYLKGGSQKSLIAGGLSAAILCFVYTILPSNPVLASSVGLGLSVSLLGIMGSRFMKSRKIFPAGIVTFASFIMSGGYLHGILRSFH